MALTYEQRMRAIAAWLEPKSGFLSLFKPPQGLQGESIKTEVVEIAQAINSVLPTQLSAETMRSALDRLHTDLRRNSKTRGWPVIRDFVEAAKAAAPRAGMSVSDGSGEIDLVALNAKRVKAGQPVGDSWLYGVGAQKMINAGHIIEDDLWPYRDGIKRALRMQYGGEYAEQRIAEMEAR